MERPIPLLLWVLAIIGFIYLLMPIVIVVLAGLTAGDFLTFPPEGFSLRWVKKFLTSEKYMSSFLFSFSVSTDDDADVYRIGYCCGHFSIAQRFSRQKCTPVFFLIATSIAWSRDWICTLRVLYQYRDWSFAHGLGFVDWSYPLFHTVCYRHCRCCVGSL